ncbi:hypothetical protein [uncultured Thermanaerothrix sp.]|uniref:hypothetical protein n=1 Tax=uncultured Thermanaerothrix sp. TaxID=1195149 RepID=UPI00260DBBB6|nr:hypothetical protein [uncultured Thermanaerothrix sp.]
MRSQSSFSSIVALSFLFPAVCGAGLLLYAMRWGPWVYSDSVAYILSARNWITGHGLGIYNPSGEFDPMMPPGYPWLIGALLALNLDPLRALATVNSLCFALCVLMLGWGTWHFSGSWGWGWTTALLVLLAPGVIMAFDGAMSEPLYMLLALLNLFLLALYTRSPRPGLGILAALCAAGAGLMRTIGLVNLAVGVVVILIVHRHSLREAALRASGYALLAGTLPLAWLFRETLPTRPFVLSSALLAQANALRQEVTRVLLEWMPFFKMLPASWLKSLAVLGLGLLAALGFGWTWRQTRKQRERKSDLSGGLTWWAIMALYALGYLLFLGLAYLFSSLQPDIDTRLLMPCFIALATIIPGGLFLALRSRSSAPYWQGLLTAVILLSTLAYYLPATLSYLSARHATGSGYSGLRWRESETLRAVRDLPANLPFVSNQTAAVLFYTQRYPYEITRLIRADLTTSEQPFGSGESEDETVFRTQCAALILFEPEFSQQMQALYDHQATHYRATFTAGLRLYRRLNDGAIYFHPACPKP